MTDELRAATLARNICPSCHSSAIDNRPDFLACRTCGVRGDPNTMKWCEKVPVFRFVAKEDLWLVIGQIYKYNEALFSLAGYAPGCGRFVGGDYCHECRQFLPEAIERPSKKKKKEKGEAGGKDAAAGEREVEV